jgi:hypothetical protein
MLWKGILSCGVRRESKSNRKAIRHKERKRFLFIAGLFSSHTRISTSDNPVVIALKSARTADSAVGAREILFPGLANAVLRIHDKVINWTDFTDAATSGIRYDHSEGARANGAKTPAPYKIAYHSGKAIRTYSSPSSGLNSRNRL